MEQEAPFSQPGQRLLHALPVEISAMRYALQPLHDAGLVPFGLQPANHPGPRIRQPAVVEIHRVLCRQHEPEAVGARLFQQCQEQLL